MSPARVDIVAFAYKSQIGRTTREDRSFSIVVVRIGFRSEFEFMIVICHILHMRKCGECKFANSWGRLIGIRDIWILYIKIYQKQFSHVSNSIHGALKNVRKIRSLRSCENVTNHFRGSDQCHLKGCGMTWPRWRVTWYFTPSRVPWCPIYGAKWPKSVRGLWSMWGYVSESSCLLWVCWVSFFFEIVCVILWWFDVSFELYRWCGDVSV